MIIRRFQNGLREKTIYLTRGLRKLDISLRKKKIRYGEKKKNPKNCGRSQKYNSAFFDFDLNITVLSYNFLTSIIFLFLFSLLYSLI